ncbi:glycoside hydrolase family 3 N-terminal domain-containing protein [Salinimicrobium sediminilitoris]|uniref:glycoside hydrolase family 3 N-terminal domain-containing protein n=1 Tax=Salinimicrobium sediminilitoris TaxID=2876715 RepID=UPI001E48E010|nr:glycoside hydrolase family 3 N-terminal domain-containing protein [Salinimicrobium sediminilitoris]MCC8359507.1 serine hydrolase [Salinimicrobium sediminilitoris]
MKEIKFLPFLTLLFFAAFQASAQTVSPEFLQYRNSEWVDSIMTGLSLEEKIGQLIMVAAYSNRGEKHKKEILKLIEEQKIGGLIFFQGDAESQVELMNGYQEASKVPLIGAIDAEWGLGMRLDNTISYPFQMALGAIQDNQLLYEMGKEMARQVRLSGLHVNFAPVVDVNNNPANPVINFRSFGEDKINVSTKSIAYMKGMQDHKLFTTAKHFPGHGDTDTDSHYALPQINHPLARLDSLELYPFRRLIEAGVGGVMVAHLNIPALDASGLPSTLSRPIITELLKERLNFEGLIVTDAMNMMGVTKGNLPGVVDKDAILAGNDLLEFTEDVPKTIEEVKKAVELGLISEAEIDDKVRKVLAVKQWVGLNEYERVKKKGLEKKLNSPAAKYLHEQLVEASLTVLKNDKNSMPLKELDLLKIALVSIGAKKRTEFQKSLRLYTEVEDYQLPMDADASDIAELRKELQDYNLVIVGIHDDSRFPRNSMKFSDSLVKFIAELSGNENTLISFFKNPYVIDKLKNIENAPALLLTYQDSEMTQKKAAEVIFGGIGATGKLPVSIGDKFKAGAGIDLQERIRLSYSMPEAVGMNSEVLEKGIDSLMQQAMQLKATPGGQVLVAKDQKVIFYKAYGEHVYHDTITVEKTDLYDLASVTKIAATMPAIMQLYEEGKFGLDQTLADHLKDFRRSNKKDIPYRDILAHQAGFQPWIPFWKKMYRKNGSFRWWTVQQDSSKRYPIKIADDMYLHRNYHKKIRKAIRKSDLTDKKEYVYSDFFFILAPWIVQNITGENFDRYLQEEFYDPLGATSLMFNPAESFSTADIVPTENDFFFRNKLIHGNVHDEGAILLGGISGHAGLFSNANDLAKLLQMFLNGGEYGGRRYLEEETLAEFTRTQFPENDNRRALGFDKPNLEYKGVSNNTARDASKESFGHAGFTGTLVWMDLQYNLLYIFLSNRVYPTRDNNRLSKLNTRTQVQQVLYDALKSSKD